MKDPERTVALKKFVEQPWRTTCYQIAAEFDLAYLGGFNYLKEDKSRVFEQRFLSQLDAMLPPGQHTNRTRSAAHPTPKNIAWSVQASQVDLRNGNKGPAPGINEVRVKEMNVDGSEEVFADSPVRLEDNIDSSVIDSRHRR